MLTLVSPAQPIAHHLTAAGDEPASSSPVNLEWTPPEWAALGQLASVKNSFVFDRTMLAAAASLLPDSDAEARQSLRKLDGISVHLYRFPAEAAVDPDESEHLEQLREAYHNRGWKHLISAKDNVSVIGHNGKTDLWLALDGVNVRGGTLLVVTPRSASMITFAGNLSPIDLLHLRGHFGIPKFDADHFKADQH